MERPIKNWTPDLRKELEKLKSGTEWSTEQSSSAPESRGWGTSGHFLQVTHRHGPSQKKTSPNHHSLWPTRTGLHRLGTAQPHQHSPGLPSRGCLHSEFCFKKIPLPSPQPSPVFKHKHGKQHASSNIQNLKRRASSSLFLRGRATTEAAHIKAKAA